MQRLQTRTLTIWWLVMEAWALTNFPSPKASNPSESMSLPSCSSAHQSHQSSKRQSGTSHWHSSARNDPSVERVSTISQSWTVKTMTVGTIASLLDLRVMGRTYRALRNMRGFWRGKSMWLGVRGIGQIMHRANCSRIQARITTFHERMHIFYWILFI